MGDWIKDSICEILQWSGATYKGLNISIWLGLCTAPVKDNKDLTIFLLSVSRVVWVESCAVGVAGIGLNPASSTFSASSINISERAHRLGPKTSFVFPVSLCFPVGQPVMSRDNSYELLIVLPALLCVYVPLPYKGFTIFHQWNINPFLGEAMVSPCVILLLLLID